MLYDGPWAQSIVDFEPSTSLAFERYFAVARRATTDPEQQFGKLPALSTETRRASSSSGRPDGAFGVLVNGQIEAVALFSLNGTDSSNRLMRLLMGVAADHRRRGMGTALLMRATAMARQAGLRYLVLEDVDADGLGIAHLASADLVFSNGECQGWIEIAPLSPAPTSTEFAEVRLG